MEKPKESEQEVKTKRTAEQIRAEAAEITQLKTQVADLTNALRLDKELKEQEQATVIEAAKAAEAEKLAAAADLKKLLGSGERGSVEELNNQEILNIVADAVETSQVSRGKQTAKLIEDATAANGEQLKGIQQVLMKLVAIQGVNEAKAKFPDFDDFREDAARLMETIPGLPPDKAILLAKAERAGASVPKKKVESERPGSVVTVPGQEGLAVAINRRTEDSSVEDNKNVGSGIVGFRALLKSGVDKAIVNDTG